MSDGDRERERERADLDLAEAERERVDQPREQHDGRDQEHGDLRGRGERDLGRELDLARGRRRSTAPPCSAALPTIATITAATKKSDSPAFSANVSSEPTRISATSAVSDGRDAERGERLARTTSPSISSSLETCSAWWRRSEYHGDDHVDDEQHDRDGHREERRPSCRSGSPSQLGIAGSGTAGSRRRSTPNERKLDAPVDLAACRRRRARTRARAGGCRRREPVSDPRTTSVSPSWTAISAMISSGAFPNVALRKPPIPGPVCSAACSVASPISHASGISASAESTNSVRRAEVGRRSGGRSTSGARASPRRGFGAPWDGTLPGGTLTRLPRRLRQVLRKRRRPLRTIDAMERSRARPRGTRPSCRCVRRTRSSAAAARCTATRSSTRAPASSGRAPFVYAYEAFGHTYMGCMQKVFDVEIDLDLLRGPPSARRDGLRGGQDAPGAAADVPGGGRVVLRAAHRRDRAAGTRSSSSSRSSARASASSRGSRPL